MKPDSAASPPPSQQELRAGRYVLLQPLGQGAQGTTWDAVDKREGRAVAVKAFDVRGASSWKDVELAEREARILSELDHPLLPHYIEHFEEDGVLYLVMEKVHGTPLSVLQKQASRMSEKDVIRFLHDVDRTLSYLHTRNPSIIHRDIKPGNVIRRADGAYALVDFGAVRDHLRPEGGSTVVGTFGYMAPEQFQGRASPASDVYGAGATAIALLTGKEPEKLPHRGLTIDVAAALGPGVSPRLQEALARMVDSNPDTRASSIGPLLDRVGGERPRDRDAATRADDVRGPWNLGRRAAKEARKQARRATREARAQARAVRRPRGEVPFIFRAVALVALAYAQVWVALTLQAFVPALLTLLSVVFGRPLRDAARRVSDAGARAVAGIAEKQRQLSGSDSRDEESKSEPGDPINTGVRVTSREPRVRVETRAGRETQEPRDKHEPEEPSAEEALDDETEPPAKERRRRV